MIMMEKFFVHRGTRDLDLILDKYRGGQTWRTAIDVDKFMSIQDLHIFVLEVTSNLMLPRKKLDEVFR